MISPDDGTPVEGMTAYKFLEWELKEASAT
jgi:hypothetical protein